MNVRMRFLDLEDFISARNIIWEPLDGFHISPAQKLIEFPNTDNPYKEQPLECGFCHNGILEVPAYDEKGAPIIKQVPCDECNGTGLI